MTNKSAILRLSRLQDEFTEPSLRTFLKQFGSIKRLELLRSSKTGRSKRIAFVEFESSEVARIAAETLDGYIVKLKPMVARVLAEDDSFEFRGRPVKAYGRRTHDQNATKYNAQSHESLPASIIKKDAKRTSKLAKHGIEYNFKRPTIKPSDS